MPMGLCNVPATFQSLMNSIFGEFIDAFLVVNLEDFVIDSDSYENHLKHLEMVLSCLQDNQIYVGRLKCKITTTKTEFLGLQLGIHGIEVGKDRKRIVQEWPQPKSYPKLEGSLGYYKCLVVSSRISRIWLLFSHI